jgi:hypothetical protein
MTDGYRLLPILREGIEVIRMVLFKKLQVHLSEKYPEKELQFINRLAGATINNLFGTYNQEEPFLSFSQENAAFIGQEMKAIAVELEEMRIPLTDALRIQFLCDSLGGIDSSHVLTHARDIGVLIEERNVPLPDHFMNLVRRLGETSHIIHQVEIGSA